MLVDTHAHLYWKSFEEDFDEMIQRALDVGVTTIINVGVDPDLSQTALEQVQNQLSRYPKLQAYSTIGIHPHEALRYAQGKHHNESIHQDIKKLSRVYQSSPKKVVAVGECGLDYFFDNNPDFVAPTPPAIPSDNEESQDLKKAESRDPSATPQDDKILTPEILKSLQKQLFKAQIDLAKKLNLPLIVHCRDDRSKNPENSEAWNEVLGMIGSHPAILHCYSGLQHTTYSILYTPNLLVSFAATITYPKNGYLREAAKVLPLEKIVLETDCPFLPPQSKRGQRNEPASVKEIAQLVADIKGVSFEELAQQTTQNLKQLLKTD